MWFTDPTFFSRPSGFIEFWPQTINHSHLMTPVMWFVVWEKSLIQGHYYFSFSFPTSSTYIQYNYIKIVISNYKMINNAIKLIIFVCLCISTKLHIIIFQNTYVFVNRQILKSDLCIFKKLWLHLKSYWKSINTYSI